MKKVFLFVPLLTLCLSLYAQQDSVKMAVAKKETEVLKPVKLSLNEDGSSYIQLTGLVQTWVRYNYSNPGTTVNNLRNSETFDIGLRRVRFQIIGQLSKRVLFYSQLGMNSISYLSERKFGFFVHDAIGEYTFVPKRLSFGAGLGSWVGPLRFSSPSVASIMGYDAPLYQQTTNDLNDQFVRKMMIYAKGKIGKLDYRIGLSKPFIVNSTVNSPANITGGQAAVRTLAQVGNNVSTFSVANPSPQVNSYVSYQFFDQEANILPFNAGTYLGTKKILNVGAGIQYQQDAMWHKELNASTGNIDTISTPLLTAGGDVFLDMPINKERGCAVSFYAAYMYSDYGPNYIRNFAPMNPADPNSTLTGVNYNSGGGASFPINGTGNTFWIQAGYKLKNNLLGSAGTLMPYVMTQISKYNNFSESMITYDIGINWLMKAHNSKLSLNYNNRPVFLQVLATDPVAESTRRGMVVLQYQVAF